jgi:hypothetical protein
MRLPIIVAAISTDLCQRLTLIAAAFTNPKAYLARI